MSTKQIENCILGLCLLHELPDEKVYLDDWTIEGECGSAHCFGGWVAVTPEFRAQGVRADEQGSPYMPGVDYLETSLRLFGDAGLFYVRGTHVQDVPFNRTMTDRELVVRRLEAQIVKLSEHEQ